MSQSTPTSEASPFWLPGEARDRNRAFLIRRSLLLLVDALLIAVSFVGAFALRVQGDTFRFFDPHLPLLPWAVVCGLTVLASSGWYRSLTRYSGSLSLYGLLPRSGLFVLLLLLISTLQGGPQPPRSFWILFWMLFSGSAIASRILLRDLLRLRLKGFRQSEGLPTVIYGVGEPALRLLEELRHDPRFRLVAAVDEEPSCWGRRLQTLPIHGPHNLEELIDRHGISQVLLAIPEASRRRRRLLVDRFSFLGLKVLVVPSLGQLASGECQISELRPVAIEDLLGREPSEADAGLLGAAVSGRSVLVTGAGGSIGGELCRQVMGLQPSRLVLLERNELALYSIEQELIQLAQAQGSLPSLRPVLADVGDQRVLQDLMVQEGVAVVFHAAAYKHVPLVELNVCAGVANNLLGTRSVLAAALGAGIERFILISTDKAVRPTNAMGASKRACELLVQAAALEISRVGEGPICTMVRFGNVLGSSGSVIPRFRAQIAGGGPLTVTHPEMTRYFMTIPEAAQLVLQAAGMAQGGEVFLLDMGEPVRILDLAHQMIQLSGLRVRDTPESPGDISIQFSGLRPGEKLYEELLISPDDAPTRHPLIRQAREGSLDPGQLQHLMHQMERALANRDPAGVTRLLQAMVAGYVPSPEGQGMGPGEVEEPGPRPWPQLPSTPMAAAP